MPQIDSYDYKSMTKAKLIYHVEAYAEALHDLNNELHKTALERAIYKKRLDELQRIREFFHQ